MTEPRRTVLGVLMAELEADPAAREELREMIGATGAPADTAEQWLSTRQAAERLGINYETCRRFAKTGRIVGAEWDGSRWRFRSSELEIIPLAPLPGAGPGRGRRGRTTSNAAAAIRGQAA